MDVLVGAISHEDVGHLYIVRFTWHFPVPLVVAGDVGRRIYRCDVGEYRVENDKERAIRKRKSAYYYAREDT